MHQYLKAIGFDKIQSKKELKELLKKTEDECTQQIIVSYNEKSSYCELRKEYGQGVGIILCGELDEMDHFEIDYYVPYFEGSGITTCSDVMVERRKETET